MINETLDVKQVTAPSGLTKFWTHTTRRFCQNTTFLLDIGAASGRFLFFIKDSFAKILGLEVSAPSLAFAQSTMHLPVVNTLTPQDITAVSCVTAWHTLEHIPVADIATLLSMLRSQASQDCVYIISVPNGSSLWGFFFMKYFSFYDVREHLHQFSYRSLELLLKQHHLSIKHCIPALPYSGFNAVQSILNVITGTHNYLYYYLKRSQSVHAAPSKLRTCIHLALAACIAPLAAPIILFELLCPRYAAALTVICSHEHH